MRRPDVWSGVTLAGYAVVGLLLVLPLAGLAAASVTDPETGALSLANYRAVLTESTYRDAIGHSLLTAGGGALGAVLLGVPLAVLTSRYRIPGRDLITTLALLSLLSPPFIGAYAWIMLLGNSGLLQSWGEAVGLALPTVYGPGGVVLVFSLQYYPFVFLLTSGALSAVDRSLEEAARSLGAGPWRGFRRVTLPLVLPSASAGALLAFVLSLANFGAPMILSPDERVLATLAYDLFTSEVGRTPGRAAAVSAVLVALAAGALALQRYAASRRRVSGDLLRRPLVRELRGWRHALATGAAYAIVGLSTLPLAVVVVTSFRNTSGPVLQPGFGLDSYRQVLYGVPRAISNSLVFSATAVAGIVVAGTLLGYVLARRRSLATRALDGLLVVPYVVPGIVLGIGLVVTFGGLAAAGTGAVIVAAYFVRRLPYAVRASASFLEQVDPSLEEAARDLGAPPGRAFRRVTLPLMGPAVLSGAILGWVTAINELSASIVLYVGRTVTMPVKIYLAVLDGYFGPASALATILLAVTGVSLYAVLRSAGGGREAFTAGS